MVGKNSILEFKNELVPFVYMKKFAKFLLASFYFLLIEILMVVRKVKKIFCSEFFNFVLFFNTVKNLIVKFQTRFWLYFRLNLSLGFQSIDRKFSVG